MASCFLQLFIVGRFASFVEADVSHISDKEFSLSSSSNGSSCELPRELLTDTDSDLPSDMCTDDEDAQFNSKQLQ